MIAWVDRRLNEWGRWVTEDDGLGFRNCTVEALLIRYGQPIRAGGPQREPDNPRAEQIDRLVHYLPREPRDLQALAFLRYIHGRADWQIAQQFAVSRTTVKSMVESLHRWFEGALSTRGVAIHTL